MDATELKRLMAKARGDKHRRYPAKMREAFVAYASKARSEGGNTSPSPVLTPAA